MNHSKSTDASRDPLARLKQLHREIDEHAATLARRHAERLVCRAGCSQCCVDGITVFTIEAARIRRHHQPLLTAGRPHPEGACAFLDSRGECRVYEHRPYVCRSQGLPLRWIDHDDRRRPVEFRDICPLNERASEPLETLASEACWTLGPYEARLVRLQIDHDGDPPQRVALRSLFEV